MDAIDAVESDVIALMGGAIGARTDELIRNGVPLDALERLRKEHGIDAYDVGIINRRTHDHRRSKGKPLTPDEGDRLYRTSRIVILAEEIFGNREKAIRWLQKPRRALGGISALTAITTTPGYEAVEELLQQLHYGLSA
ncbi:antitoxin Xre/MbcA/ParS toxin-binding domain-containing protein [Vreelandella neptunia]|uniref:DUF2384 domain-containing protein n=1 Tax=Vreelandella neptunia TaxID=115551 RepID=A0ABS9S1Z6_9GAMM|nr:antitoxin Xre/MbcA/ParS toxin-binding domain-containing protein [Halomonas neptunia]MCH4810133.1 DUF2384 domain-containing protein [Halomonas neptunia]